MNVLVTGSSGFCGRHLVAALTARGVNVTRWSERSRAAGVERVDFTDVRTVSDALTRVRPDVVFHLHGATASDELSTLVRANVHAAASLLDAIELAALPEPTVLLVGTAAEYGNVPIEALPVTEDAVARPLTPYGISKQAQTALGLAAGRRGRHVVVARPSNIVGRGMPQHFALAAFAKQLAEIERGDLPPVLKVGNLDSIRDFVNVDDVVADFLALAGAPLAKGRVFNVCSGAGTRLRDALDELISIFGFPVEIQTDPARLRASDVSAFVASRARLDELVGPRALVPLAVSLQHLVETTRREAAPRVDRD